jgi:hypothetical protein
MCRFLHSTLMNQFASPVLVTSGVHPKSMILLQFPKTGRSGYILCHVGSVSAPFHFSEEAATLERLSLFSTHWLPFFCLEAAASTLVSS